MMVLIWVIIFMTEVLFPFSKELSKTTDALFLWVNQFNSTNNIHSAFPIKVTENNLLKIDTDKNRILAISIYWKVNIVLIAIVQIL